MWSDFFFKIRMQRASNSQKGPKTSTFNLPSLYSKPLKILNWRCLRPEIRLKNIPRVSLLWSKTFLGFFFLPKFWSKRFPFLTKGRQGLVIWKLMVLETWNWTQKIPRVSFLWFKVFTEYFFPKLGSERPSFFTKSQRSGSANQHAATQSLVKEKLMARETWNWN